jgi:hypothetical protein
LYAGIGLAMTQEARSYLTLTLKACFMLYNLFNPDTKNGRKRIYKRAYRFYSNMPSKGDRNWNLAKVILITILLMSLAIIYSYVRLN